MSAKEFADYCWSFYGPGEIHGKFFGDKLTRAELEKAVSLRMLSPAFEGDSVDREHVRDILMIALGRWSLGSKRRAI